MVEKKYLVLGLIPWEGYVGLGEFDTLREARKLYKKKIEEFSDCMVVKIFDKRG